MQNSRITFRSMSPSSSSHILGARKSAEARAEFVRLRFKTLEIPPIRDGVVVGRAAQVSSETMQKILQLASADRFVSLPLHDDIIADVLIRESVLRKIDAEAVRDFVLQQIKPAMASSEVLSLQLEIEIVMEQAF